MKIITITCDRCETVVAANEIEERRVMKCPGLGCENTLAFDDLATRDQDHFLENREQYRI